MIEREEPFDALLPEEEYEQRDHWQIVRDLEVQLQLGVTVSQRAAAERLPRPTSLDTWKSWLVNDALRRIWEGVAQDDARLLLSSATMLMAVAKLDATGVACSLRLPAFPQAFLQKQPLLRGGRSIESEQKKKNSKDGSLSSPRATSAY